MEALILKANVDAALAGEVRALWTGQQSEILIALGRRDTNRETRLTVDTGIRHLESPDQREREKRC